MERNFAEKNREFPLQLILVDDQFNLGLSVLLRQGRPATFWSASSKSLSAGQGQWSFLLSLGEAQLECSECQAPQYKRDTEILEQVQQVPQRWLRTQSISPMRSLQVKQPGAFRGKAEREMLLLSTTSWSEKTKSDYSEMHTVMGRKPIDMS